MKKALRKTLCFLNKYDILIIDKNKTILIFLIFCLVCGMIVGSVAHYSLNMETVKKIDFLFLNDFKEKITQKGAEIFISSFAYSFICILIIEFSALTFWGAALIPILLTFRGIGLGMMGGYLYLIYGLKGIAFYVLMLLPGTFVSCIGIILISENAFKFSCKFAKKLSPRADNEPLWGRLKTHFKKSGYCLIILGVSALIDMVFTMMFSRFFEF